VRTAVQADLDELRTRFQVRLRLKKWVMYGILQKGIYVALGKDQCQEVAAGAHAANG
jgi:hypothetical protein